MIQFQDVSFKYEFGHDNAGIEHIDLTIPDGQVILLCGQSGCGKSTLTRMINGLIPHFHNGNYTGEVTVCGHRMCETMLHELAPIVGSVFQNPKSQFYTVLTDSELVFACENIGMDKNKIYSNFEQVVEEFNLQKLLGKSMFKLSGGEKQKIACASVATLKPDILVLDEPSANLDVKAKNNLSNTLRQWKNQGKTIVIAEHRIDWLMDIVDRVVLLECGKIVFDKKIEEFIKLSTKQLNDYGLRGEAGFPYINDNIFVNNTYIYLDNFSFSYDKNKTLDIKNLSIPKNSITGVIGLNGAGKSTFARCLCGLEKNIKGDIIVDGRKIKRKDLLKMSYVVMQDVNHQLFTESVWDEIILSMEKQDITQKEKEVIAFDALQKFNLIDYKDLHPMSLSGGQKQRVSIACALVSGCQILIYDEPTSGLDYKSMREVAEAILKMQKSGKTQLIITHDPELIACCCDEILMLEKGVNVLSGKMNNLIQNSIKSYFQI